MSPVTTIVHFQVPPEHVDQFFAFWRDHVQDEVSSQPGLIDGVFHRGTDPDAPFQFVNVARWESAEQLVDGLRAANENLPQMAGLFRELAVTVTQDSYVEAVRYTHAGGAAGGPGHGGVSADAAVTR